MSFFGDRLFSSVRNDMKARTREILTAIKGLNRGLNGHSRALGRIGSGVVPDSVKKELKSNMETILKQERQLDEALHKHIEFLEKLSRQL